MGHWVTNMTATTVAIFLPTIVLYIVAAVLFTRQFFSTKANSSQTPDIRVALIIMSIACFGHFALMVITSYDIRHNHLSIAHVAAALSLLVSMTMLITNRYIKNIIFLPVVSGVSALFISLHMLAPDSAKIITDMPIGLVGHIVLSLFSFGVLSISFLYAVQLTYISHQLKHKKLHLLSATLPPLMLVETILQKLMLAGTVMLFLALVSGFVFVPNMFLEGYAHKTLLSLVAFAIYTIALVIHSRIGLRSRILALVNFVGLGLLTLAYFGSRIVSEMIL